MQISYRALRLSAWVGLLALTQARAALPTPPTPQDSLKGRLWTATARQIWADTKPPQAQPAAWPTVEAFEAWLLATPADKSELGLLRSDVVKSFGAGAKGTPEQVAQAIIAQITQRQQSKKGRLTRLNLTDLQASFAALTQAKTINSGLATPTPDSASPKAAARAATPLTVAEDTHPQPEGQLPTTPTYTTTPLAPRYFGLPPTIAGLALLLLGGLAGAGLARALRSNSRQHDHPASAEPDSSAIMNSPQYRKLQKQYQTLNTQLHRLQQELAELKQHLMGTPEVLTTKTAQTQTPPAASAPVAAEATSIEELIGAPAEVATPAPAATRYGPVQETSFVEERKIVDAPLPQLALMITVSPRNPDQATFTLNPQVDQARLIGDGLTRLQKFFDYDPPVAGRITAVAAVKAGKLQRQATGWQVVERAKLLIS